MQRLLIGLCFSICLLAVGDAAFAGAVASGNHQRIGLLSCTIVPHSGLNLLIHSTKQVRCAFSPATRGTVEHYKGETGVGFGLDVSLNHHAKINYAVLARQFAPETRQLAGKFEGAGGGITLGLSVGNNASIQNRDGSIILQPVNVRGSGIGAAAGFTYLYLQSDPR